MVDKNKRKGGKKDDTAPSSKECLDSPPVISNDEKRLKIDNHDNDNTKTNTEQIMETAWECYRNYLDSACAEEEEDDENEEDQEPDVDGLMEVVELLTPLLCKNKNQHRVFDPTTVERTTRLSLMPALLSAAHGLLAHHFMEQGLFETEETSNDDEEAAAAGTTEEMAQMTPQYHLDLALTYFPHNPAALSARANVLRMHPLAAPYESSWDTICSHYEQSATHAATLRTWAMNRLEDSATDEPCKEWIESMLLDSLCGVEFEPKEFDDDDDDEDPETKQDNDEEEEGEFSSSSVEAMAAFMAAMLRSTLGQHEKAEEQLRKFQVTHVLHPNVWNVTNEHAPQKTKPVTSTRRRSRSSSRSTTTTTSAPSSSLLLFEPQSFGRRSGEGGDASSCGCLPPALYERLCHVFRPEAPYWTESGYAHRGYYSYFMDLASSTTTSKTTASPTNLLEHMIQSYLLPLATATMTQEDNETKNENDGTTRQIVGAEWWVHTRPLDANLGHQLHFDTDEALLNRDQHVTHPLVSSVLYLTGGSHPTNETSSAGGPTIILHQTPDSSTIASQAWYSHCQDNTFMTFPGNLLHGVLPCPGTSHQTSVVHDETKTKQTNGNRLTFMVGFWTRRVPDEMEDYEQQPLYGPCGPLPPATEEHSWVQEICEGYPLMTKDNGSTESLSITAMGATGMPVPQVSPAWKVLTTTTQTTCASKDDNDDSPTLMIPKASDHRFFVQGAPQCFRDSLFQPSNHFE
eukprot:scaffold46400_cov56-Attheya_sp.AAC.2